MDLVQFQAKTLKFRSCLADLILGGKKTTTWRLYDDKDLKNGDLLNFRVWETGKDFAKAVITGIKEKRIRELKEEDFEGHEKFENEKDMVDQYREYYGDKVNTESVVKIINFNLNR